MPTMNEHQLDTGDKFPDIELKKLGGGTISLPGDLAGGWGVILFYRGYW